MSEASKRTLTQLDKLVSNERRNPRKVFMKIFFAGEFYKMDRNRLISEAKKAGAFYIIGNVKLPIKLFIRIIQIPLTIIYFILSFFGSVISGLGWLFGVMIFGATICLWAFGEFDSWYQVATALALSTAIVILPGWLTEFIGEGILFLKKALSDISI